MLRSCLKKGSYCRVMLVGGSVVAIYISALALLVWVLTCLAYRGIPSPVSMCP